MDIYDFIRVSGLGALTFSNNGGCDFGDKVIVPAELSPSDKRKNYLACYRSKKEQSEHVTPNYFRVGAGIDLTVIRLNDYHVRAGFDYGFAAMFEGRTRGRTMGGRLAIDYVDNRIQDRPKAMLTGECRLGKVNFESPVGELALTETNGSPPIVWEADCRVGIRLSIF